MDENSNAYTNVYTNDPSDSNCHRDSYSARVYSNALPEV
jgi:hypothetical protein